ncbi:MAG: aspartate/glutamate racemase family protein [SAR324 cluster bacterium]|nr:aspartate/glutamate racemase family protein [SAR324 cluster bacterium]
MKIVITDSGLGGLSICAFLANYLKYSNFTKSIEIVYVNAVPRDDLGYNQMQSRQQKVETFNDTLYGIQHWYQPDFILIACNTLSTLVQDTSFAKNESVSIEEIIHIGVDLILQHLSESHASGVFIFATDTTIEDQIYTRQLGNYGIAEKRMVSQAFTGVATMISNDPEGKKVYQEIKKFIMEAHQKMKQDFLPMYAFLGCTHYGYRKTFFKQAFAELGYNDVTILNPNECAFRHVLFSQNQNSSGDREPTHLTIEFASRYALPEKEISTLSQFLAPYSSQTVHALQNYTLKSNLF